MSITKQETPPPAVLRRTEAAKYCGLSVATFNRLAISGGGPLMTELSPGCVGYLVTDLLDWLASRPKRRSTSEIATVRGTTERDA